jgi:hypothetical protein
MIPALLPGVQEVSDILPYRDASSHAAAAFRLRLTVEGVKKGTRLTFRNEKADTVDVPNGRVPMSTLSQRGPHHR